MQSKNIYDAMQLVYIISKILGIAPFKATRKKLSLQYGLIVPLRIVIIVGVMCYVAFQLEKVNFHTRIEALALRCELYLETFVTISILVLAAFKQQAFINIIKELVNIDEHMKNIFIRLNYNNSKKLTVVQMILVTCLFILKIILQYLSYSPDLVLIHGAFNYLDYINTIMVFQYVNLILLVRQRFIRLNRKLTEVFTSPLYWNKSRISLISNLNHPYTNVSIIAKMKIEILLSDLAKIYTKLCRESRLINTTYNIQILITVASRFLMITTQLINTYDSIRDPSPEKVTEYVVLTLHLGFHFLKIFMIAIVSENTTLKAKETGIHLHNLWELMPEFKTELKYFSLQILHQNLKFTGCGFFALDNTLIYSIVGAVATYFIIVIQLERTF